MAQATPIKDFLSSFMLGELFKGMRLTGRHFLSKKVTIQYPEEKTPLSPALSRPARAAPLRERRGALHRLQAVRGGLPGAGDHDRERRPRRRLAPDDALRHRPHQVHLLRLLRGELPGRLDRRDAHPRVPRREARRPVLHQGHAARRRRPLRKRDRRGEGGGREIPLTAAWPPPRAASRRGRHASRTMDTNTALFYVFSAVLLLAAFRVITARSPVYAALFLVLAFFSAACVWILLRAEFLAIALVLVYVGAVMVLFLFVVMMLDVDVGSLRAGFWKPLPGRRDRRRRHRARDGGGAAARVSPHRRAGDVAPRRSSSATPSCSASRSTPRYLYPLQIAAVLLLVAIIAAISLTLRARKDSKRIDPSEQVKAKKADRIRIVSMKPEGVPRDAPATPPSRWGIGDDARPRHARPLPLASARSCSRCR